MAAGRFKKFFQSIGRGIKKGWDVVKNVASNVGGFFTKHGDSIKDVITTVAPKYAPTINKGIDMGSGYVDKFNTVVGSSGIRPILRPT